MCSLPSIGSGGLWAGVVLELWLPVLTLLRTQEIPGMESRHDFERSGISDRKRLQDHFTS